MDLPPDIHTRLARDYSADARLAATKLLLTIPDLKPRVARCVIHLAGGNLAELGRYVQAAVTDPRDVLFWAEYEDHESEAPRRVRDLDRPFVT